MVEIVTLQMAVNGVAIASEIYGFVLMLKSTKTLVLRKGGFTSDLYVDPATSKPPPFAQSAPIPQVINTGIGFVIAGLCGQIIAMFL